MIFDKETCPICKKDMLPSCSDMGSYYDSDKKILNFSKRYSTNLTLNEDGEFKFSLSIPKKINISYSCYHNGRGYDRDYAKDSFTINKCLFVDNSSKKITDVILTSVEYTLPTSDTLYRGHMRGKYHYNISLPIICSNYNTITNSKKDGFKISSRSKQYSEIFYKKVEKLQNNIQKNSWSRNIDIIACADANFLDLLTTPKEEIIEYVNNKIETINNFG